MLVLAGTGALIAAMKPERGTAVIGVLTCYLVVTSWATVRRRDGQAGRFELYSLPVAVGCAGAMLAFGLLGASAPDGRMDSLPAAVHFPFAALAALAAGLDLNFILRGRLTGRQRIARHLWRMCTALLIAAFSILPRAAEGDARGDPGLALAVPPLATLAAMVFWIFRVQFSRAWGGRPRQSAAPITAEPVRA